MSQLSSIPWALVLPILILQFILTVVALVDLLRNKRSNGPFLLWVFVIVFVNLLGPILYFIFGRRSE